jgi:hypothetical protein
MVGKTLSFSAAALALGLLATPASAAPTAGITSADVRTGASAVEQVARRCYRHRGHWHCRGYGHGHGYSGYGYGPGVGIYIGRGHRHHRHHHRHHRHW